MRLLTMSQAEITAETNKMSRDSEAIEKDIWKMVWFMRGGLNIDQAYAMDQQQREIVAELIKENLNTTKESGLPFF